MKSIFLLVALIAGVSLASLATTPIGLLLLFPFAVAVWLIGLAAATRGAPGEALARVKRHELLGPGGPDDPFAHEPYDRAGVDR
jgi:hypothetical protein